MIEVQTLARTRLGDMFAERYATARQAQFDEFARWVPDAEPARFLKLA